MCVEQYYVNEDGEFMKTSAGRKHGDMVGLGEYNDQNLGLMRWEDEFRGFTKEHKLKVLKRRVTLERIQELAEDVSRLKLPYGEKSYFN